MGPNLLVNIEEVAAVILFGIGFTTLLLHKNMIKKIIGLNIMDTAVYLFLASMGYIEGRLAPIIVNGVTDKTKYINPIPSGLVLTGIVVSVSVTALMLGLTVRLYRRYHSLDLVMDFVQNFPCFSIVLCMVAGIVSTPMKGKQAKRVTLTVITLVAVMSVITLMYTMSTGSSFIYTMGKFPAPWGNEIRVFTGYFILFAWWN